MILPLLIVAGVVGGVAAFASRATRVVPSSGGSSSPRPVSLAAHPYRSPRIDEWGPCWGATRWVKFWVRLQQLLDPVSMHLRAERLDRRFARAERRFRENAIAHCWEQIRIDAGFLYPPHCTCGEHEGKMIIDPHELAAKWPRGEPADGIVRWQRKRRSES